MRLHHWVLACAATAAASFAGCSYNRAEAPLTLAAGESGFYFVDEGGSAKLAYGVANSDDVGLMMECAKGSQVVRVSDLMRSNAAPTLILASAGQRSELKAAVEPGIGQPLVTASAPAASPALIGFRKSGRLQVSYAGLRYGLTARAFEKPTVERFFAACDGRKA